MESGKVKMCRKAGLPAAAQGCGRTSKMGGSHGRDNRDPRARGKRKTTGDPSHCGGIAPAGDRAACTCAAANVRRQRSGIWNPAEAQGVCHLCLVPAEFHGDRWFAPGSFAFYRGIAQDTIVDLFGSASSAAYAATVGDTA